jgi:hypothetical protein
MHFLKHIKCNKQPLISPQLSLQNIMNTSNARLTNPPKATAKES